MLDTFLKVAYHSAVREDDERAAIALLKQLPESDLVKVATGEKLSAVESDCFLDRFRGTPLFEQAIALEEEELRAEMADAERRKEQRLESQMHDAMWSARDALRIRKRLLELQLARQDSGVEGPENGAVAVPALPAPPPEKTGPASLADGRTIASPGNEVVSSKLGAAAPTEGRGHDVGDGSAHGIESSHAPNSHVVVPQFAVKHRGSMWSPIVATLGGAALGGMSGEPVGALAGAAVGLGGHMIRSRMARAHAQRIENSLNEATLRAVVNDPSHREALLRGVHVPIFSEKLGREFARRDFEGATAATELALVGDRAGRALAKEAGVVDTLKGHVLYNPTSILAPAGAGVGALAGFRAGYKKDEKGKRHLARGVGRGIAGGLVGGVAGKGYGIMGQHAAVLKELIGLPREPRNLVATVGAAGGAWDGLQHGLKRDKNDERHVLRGIGYGLAGGAAGGLAGHFAGHLGASQVRGITTREALKSYAEPVKKTLEGIGQKLRSSKVKEAFPIGAIGNAVKGLAPAASAFVRNPKNTATLLGAGAGAVGGLARGLERDEHGQRHVMRGIGQGLAGGAATGLMAHAAGHMGQSLAAGGSLRDAVTSYGRGWSNVGKNIAQRVRPPMGVPPVSVKQSASRLPLIKATDVLAGIPMGILGANVGAHLFDKKHPRAGHAVLERRVQRIENIEKKDRTFDQKLDLAEAKGRLALGKFRAKHPNIGMATGLGVGALAGMARPIKHRARLRAAYERATATRQPGGARKVRVSWRKVDDVSKAPAGQLGPAGPKLLGPDDAGGARKKGDIGPSGTLHIL